MSTTPLLASLLVSLLLLTGVFTVHRKPSLRLTAVLGLLVALLLRWSAHFAGPEKRVLLVLASLAASGYLALLTAVVLITVLGHRQITRNTVIGAVCGYVLIAYMFAFGYVALEVCAPGSISRPYQPPRAQDLSQFGRSGPELTYFSFITLTTLGYGDILPARPLARSLVILEVLAGQLYLAAFVARLVGVMRAEPDSVRRGTDASMRGS